MEASEKDATYTIFFINTNFISTIRLRLFICALYYFLSCNLFTHEQLNEGERSLKNTFESLINDKGHIELVRTNMLPKEND